MKLIYEQSQSGRRGLAVPKPDLPVPPVPDELARRDPPRLPELAEPEVLRHGDPAEAEEEEHERPDGLRRDARCKRLIHDPNLPIALSGGRSALRPVFLCRTT